MANQEIRDGTGKLIAKIRPLGLKLEIRDVSGKILGIYDLKRDVTRDSRKRLVGKGHLLATLIPIY